MGKRNAAAVGGIPIGVSDVSASVRAKQLRGLMTEHGSTIHAICKRLLRDGVLADDVLQQVFLDAHRDLGQFQGRSAIRTWLIGIAWHRCQDAIKMRQRREKRVHADEDAMINAPDPNLDVEGSLDLARVGNALEGCLGALPDKSRAAILMRFHNGMSYEEMARAVGERPSALRARVIRALPLLRSCLESKGWTGE